MFSFIIIKKRLPAPPNLPPPPPLPKSQNTGGSAGVRGFERRGLPRVAGVALITGTGGNVCVFPARPGWDRRLCSGTCTFVAPPEAPAAPLAPAVQPDLCVCAPTWPRGLTFPLQRSPERGGRALVPRRPLGRPRSRNCGELVLQTGEQAPPSQLQPGEQCGSLLCNFNSIFRTIWRERRPLRRPQQFASADKAEPGNERFNLAGAVPGASPLLLRHRRDLRNLFSPLGDPLTSDE